MTHRVSHIGLCVSDLDKALRFYCEGLGFTQAEGYDLDDTLVPGLGDALEVPSPVALRSQMITLDGSKIELLAYTSPGVVGAPSESRNERGFTHLSFFVDDVDTAAARLVEYGGTVLEKTRANLGVQILFLADPDGTRIELMAVPA